MADYFETGFSARGIEMWHGLGTVVPDEALTWAEAIQAAELDWEVELTPIYASWSQYGYSNMIEIPGQRGVQRQSDGQVLGIVSPNYKPVQNRDAFQFMDNLVDSGAAKYETAGALKSGSYVWMAANLSQIETKIAGMEDEKIEWYLLLSNSFDGTSALTVSVTPVRVVCWNTLQAALDSAKRQWRVRHRGGVEGKIEEARRALGLVFEYAQEFEALANSLIERPFTRTNMTTLLDALIPLKLTEEDQSVGGRALASKEKQRDGIMGLFANSPNLENVRGTAWAAYNAVTEYADWHRRTRSSGSNTAEANRFYRVLTDYSLKDRALDTIKEIVTV